MKLRTTFVTLALLATACGRLPSATTRPVTALGAQDAGEVQALIEAGLLPANYPALVATGSVEAARALDRQGLQGPFSDDYGDPRAYLNAARWGREHPDYARLMHTLQRGDVMFVAEDDPKDFVAQMTGGPFDHVLLCTDPTPPGRFIEAVGVTGEAGDTKGDQVRRATASRYAIPAASLRVVHPRANTERAISFAEAQLGKPYNYAFDDVLGGDRAYYCSSLIHDAFTACGYAWPVGKSPARDRPVQAFMGPALALEPTDPVDLAYRTMVFMHTNPNARGWGSFVVTTIMPRCKRTAGLAVTAEQKQRLAGAIAQVLEGRAFPRYEAAARAYKQAADAGDFDKPVTGPALRAALQARMAEACVEDGAALVKTADINTWPALQALRVLLGAVLPYADDLTAFLTGPKSGATIATARFLDALVPQFPPAKFGPKHLPGRAPWAIDPAFVSPTDLAWAGLPHQDFNVKGPLDPPWPGAIVPADHHYGAP